MKQCEEGNKARKTSTKMIAEKNVEEKDMAASGL
jgi:hypothetical protein